MSSYLAIALAALIPMILGFIWYHPKVFGSAWMKSLGMTEDDMKSGNMGLIMGLAFVTALVIAYWLYPSAYRWHEEPGMSDFVHGLCHGAMGSAVIPVMVLISNSLFQRNSLQNVLINAFYWFVTLTLMSGFVFAMYGMANPS